MHQVPYRYNSTHKEYIRERWLKFTKDIVESKPSDVNYPTILTFPSLAMQDLHLFANNGIFDWIETETGGLRVTRGKIVCFEKNLKFYMDLRKKLVNVELEQDFCKYIQTNYTETIRTGKSRVFPLDVINLDFESTFSRMHEPLDHLLEKLFTVQANFNKDFALFITGPSVMSHTEELEPYINLLINEISKGLKGHLSIKFKDKFASKYGNISSGEDFLSLIQYDIFVLVGIAKFITNCCSYKGKYKIIKTEYYKYGLPGRHQMLSWLFHFSYDGDTGNNDLYKENCERALDDIIDMTDDKNFETN